MICSTRVHLWLPFLTPKTKPQISIACAEVQSFLEWNQYYTNLHDKDNIIYINVDETAIERQQANRKGNWRQLPSV